MNSAQAEMSLFESGDLKLFKSAFGAMQSQAWMSALLDQLTWHKEFYEAHGRRFHIPRLQAWVADAGIQYSYSNNLLVVQSWTPMLLSIKRDVEMLVGHGFNSVLVTYYRNGDDHVTWHADDERELGEEPVIASLSLGARRTFQYKSQSCDRIEDVVLDEGDLLLMMPEFQRSWVHRVPVEQEVKAGRINLTFRRVVNIDAFN
jgi:alkylated DNA repair dioxygenase AlkB